MLKLNLRPAAVAMAMIVAAALVACGGEDPEPAQEAVEDPAGDTDTFGGTSLEVTAADFSFSPDTLSLDTSENAVVILSNGGNATHSFTSDELGIDIEAATGASQEAALAAPAEDATYSFYCRFHPGQMTGKIIVGSGGEGIDDSDTGEGAGENDDGIDY